MRAFRIVCLCVWVIVLPFPVWPATPTPAAPATFTSFGQIPGGFVFLARSVSPDGQVAAGTARFRLTNDSRPVSGQPERAFRWTKETGLALLQNPKYANSNALGVSSNGQVVLCAAGTLVSVEGAFLWHADGNFTDLPKFGDAYPTILSADGQFALTLNGSVYRWKDATTLPPPLSPPGQILRAKAISGNGQIVAGTVITPPETRIHAAFWASGAAPTLLPHPPDAESSQITAISTDGQTMVGTYLDSRSHTQPFRWTKATGLTALAHLVPGNAYDPIAVSDDGALVIGSDKAGTAFLWDATGAVYDLRTYFTNTLHFDLSGWANLHVTGISGKNGVYFIIGNGRHNDAIESFLVSNLGALSPGPVAPGRLVAPPNDPTPPASAPSRAL